MCVKAVCDLMTHKPGQNTPALTNIINRPKHTRMHVSQVAKRIVKICPQTCQVFDDSRHVDRGPASNTKVMCIAFEIAEHSGYRE